MKLLRKILFVVMPVMALAAAPVFADPPGGRGYDRDDSEHGYYEHGDRGRKHHRHREERKEWHGFHGGPPPWAPAYGYRRGHDDDDHYVATVPVNVQTGTCNRELIGQIVGGATGGLVGSQIGDGTGRLVAVAAGTVIGMIVGGEVGRSMDRTDKLCVDQALENAPDGTKIHWNDNDRQYTVTPQNTQQNADGQYCREYQTETQVGGKTQNMYGKACRQPDGSWKIVS